MGFLRKLIKENWKKIKSGSVTLPRLDSMNGASAAATENQNGLASPPTLPVDEGVDVSQVSLDEETRAELEEEVEDLKDDRTYHDFINNVVDHKEIAEEDEAVDGDFVVEETQLLAQSAAIEKGAAAEEVQDGAESDSSSTLTDFEEEEDVEKAYVEACGDAGIEIKIPKEALRDAEKRFPHFWRTKHAIKTEYREGDYVEEQDPDYEPEKDKEAVDLDDTQDEESGEVALENSGND